MTKDSRQIDARDLALAGPVSLGSSPTQRLPVLVMQ
jgi:hypothetical protein